MAAKANLAHILRRQILIFDLTNILLPKHLIFQYRLIAEAINYQSRFTDLKLTVVIFQFKLWLLIRAERGITLGAFFCSQELEAVTGNLKEVVSEFMKSCRQK